MRKEYGENGTLSWNSLKFDSREIFEKVWSEKLVPEKIEQL